MTIRPWATTPPPGVVLATKSTSVPGSAVGSVSLGPWVTAAWTVPTRLKVN